MSTFSEPNDTPLKKYTPVWLLCSWLLVMLYTVLVKEKVPVGYSLAPLVLFFLVTLYLLVQVFDKRDRLKTALWLGVVTLSLTLLFILYGLEYLDTVMLAGFVTVLIVLSCISWCFLSHMKHATDPGWHWYVVSVLVSVLVCIAAATRDTGSSDTDSTAVSVTTWIFAGNLCFVLLLHVHYLYYLYVNSANNWQYYRTINRVVGSGIVSLLVLVGLLVFDLKEVDTWLTYLLVVEAVVVAAFLVDIWLIYIGSKLSPHDRYVQVETVETVETVGTVGTVGPPPAQRG